MNYQDTVSIVRYYFSRLGGQSSPIERDRFLQAAMEMMRLTRQLRRLNKKGSTPERESQREQHQITLRRLAGELGYDIRFPCDSRGWPVVLVGEGQEIRVPPFRIDLR